MKRRKTGQGRKLPRQAGRPEDITLINLAEYECYASLVISYSLLETGWIFEYCAHPFNFFFMRLFSIQGTITGLIFQSLHSRLR
jgi:hypothetical protein